MPLHLPAASLVGILPVHLDSHAERDPQGLDQLLARCVLAIDARDFLNPADPPAAALDDGGELRLSRF
jgi:hypothetical protein